MNLDQEVQQTKHTKLRKKKGAKKDNFLVSLTFLYFFLSKHAVGLSSELDF